MRESGKQFIDDTLELWRSRTSRVLSREDAREIVENVTGFFKILAEWETAGQHIASQLTKNKTDTTRHATGLCPK
jgi:hypothetical protein